ncbi:MAG: TerC family protein [Deltaproteobacteria bacterium]|nr:TerC family protein [Deltaproteobacteria bacterium]
MLSIGGPALWTIFAVVVVTMLVVDLGIFHRKAHVVRFREAAIWSAVWIGLALSFNVIVYFKFGSDRALEFFQAWLIEKALSVDNIFVFLAIFSYFAVEPRLQHRVLFWGILGALLTRGVFIWTGAALLRSFHWVMYLFGGFLILTAIRMLMAKDEDIHPDRNPVIRLFKRFVPVSSEYHGTHFFVRRDKRLVATPLFLVLVVVEATDVVFAVDSIPAVFAITQDVFIVYTSNIFAVLGLRALAFLVADLVRRLRYLKVGLSLVLAFIGAKMILDKHVHISEWLSMGIVVSTLLGSAAISLLFVPRPAAPAPRQADPSPGSNA